MTKLEIEDCIANIYLELSKLKESGHNFIFAASIDKIEKTAELNASCGGGFFLYFLNACIKINPEYGILIKKFAENNILVL